MKGDLHWNWKGGNKNTYKKKEKYNTNDYYKRYEYELVSPTGNVIKTKSMRKTCEEYGLDYRTMSKVVNEKRKSHKGWTAKIIQNLTT